MSSQLVYQAAKLMKEQAIAYRKLLMLCERLETVMAQGDLTQVEILTRAGEGELLSIRSRLTQLMSTLTEFAAARNAEANKASLGAEVRAEFETASNELIEAARNFLKIRGRATALAINGMTFSNACIEACGIKPTTYNAPFGRSGDKRPWA